MANELTTGINFSYVKDGVSENFNLSRQSDIATGRVSKASQVIGTSEEQFSLVDVAAARYVVVQNLDETNFVQVGTAAGAYSVKLLPGDIAMFPPNASALFLKADTASCTVNVLVVGA
jgi:hypothetical protein